MHVFCCLLHIVESTVFLWALATSKTEQKIRCLTWKRKVSRRELEKAKPIAASPFPRTDLSAPLRFRGLTVADIGDHLTAELESLQIPQKFYLPEALPVEGTAGRKKSDGRLDQEGKDEEKVMVQQQEEDDSDRGGVLSFSAVAMDVNARPSHL